MHEIGIIVVLVVAIAVSGARAGDAAVAVKDAPAQPQPVLCGAPPEALHGCLANRPTLVPPTTTSSCKTAATQCERLKCVFESAGWTREGELERHLQEVGRRQPAWGAAVQRARADCLAARLPPQGVLLQCPEYDIMQCILAAFFKNAPSEAWGTGAACEAARAFAQACPFCPEDCFAPAIPVNTCNACRVLPRTP